jgi:hypothetical protein
MGTSEAVTNLIPEDTFSLVLELESQKAVRLRYCLSVVVLWADVKGMGVSGPERDDLSWEIAHIVARQVRVTDLVTRFSSSSEIALLLIDAETEAISRILQRTVTGLAANYMEGSVVWSAGGASFPSTVSTGGALLPRASELMSRAREDGGDRLYILH